MKKASRKNKPPRKVPRKLNAQARIARDLRQIASELSDLNRRAVLFEVAVSMLAKGIAPLIYDLRRRPDEIGFDPDDFVVFDDLVQRATKGWGHG